ncbi:MAG: HNH endonuclease signature motif containing protein [Ruminococcus sp.]
MPKRYPPEFHEFMRQTIPGHTTKELVVLIRERFGYEMAETAIKSYKTAHKIKSGTPKGHRKGECPNAHPAWLVDYIIANHKGLGPTAMAEKVNKEFGTEYTHGQIKGIYARNKLKSGIDTKFKKGHEPANKGRKGYHAPGSEKGWFKKGGLPPNTKPVGYERINKDSYIEVKIKMRPSRPDCNDNFKAKHRLVWEEANGPIPEDCVIMFRDGDKQNCSLENLRLITKSEHATLNKLALRSNNPETTESELLLANIAQRRSAMTKELRERKKKRRKSNGKEKKLQNDTGGENRAR